MRPGTVGFVGTITQVILRENDIFIWEDAIIEADGRLAVWETQMVHAPDPQATLLTREQCLQDWAQAGGADQLPPGTQLRFVFSSPRCEARYTAHLTLWAL